jgi:hypothetical protein
VRQDKHFSVTPVYLSSLKNPNTAPQDQLRATVVPGQIERSGSIFEVVLDKKLPNDGTRFSQVSDFLQAYGPNLGLTLVVDETLNSSVLEACLCISSDLREQQIGMLFPGHRYLSCTLPRVMEEFRMIGPADIRRKIVTRSLSRTCRSRTVRMHTLAVHENDFIPWAGQCFYHVRASQSYIERSSSIVSLFKELENIRIDA